MNTLRKLYLSLGISLLIPEFLHNPRGNKTENRHKKKSVQR
jgi:hypothetical protein